MIHNNNTAIEGNRDVIDISDITMIQVISDLGSINKAAEVLNISQPTLSKKVSRLEQKIKMELFYRDNAGMLPTKAAKFLLCEGDQLRTQLGVIERKLELMANGMNGCVRVGVGPIIEQVILPKVLLDFAESDYSFKIAVTTMSQATLLEQLKRSEIDIAIGPFSDDDVPDNLVVPLCASEPLVVAVRQGHPLCQQANINLDDMAHYKTVSPNVPKSLGHQVSMLIEGRELAPEIECENYAMAKTIVANSDYVTAGPKSLFHNEFASGELVMIDFERDVSWRSKCLAKPESLLTPIIREVVKIFSEYMQPGSHSF